MCTGVPERIVALDAAPELYTVLYTIVGCRGALFFRSFRPSTSAIMSHTTFAVKSLSLRSDTRFTEADDGVDTDVIRAVCRGTQCGRRADLTTLRIGLQLIRGHGVLDKVSFEANCEDPDRLGRALIERNLVWKEDGWHTFS